MSMNEDIARIYNTNGINSSAEEDLSKEAQYMVFAKVASAHGVDLSGMGDDEVKGLYEQVMGESMDKAAEDDGEKKPPFPPKKEEKKDDDKEEEDSKEAAAYFLEKKAEQDKLAEADLMGRVMAHSFWQEFGEIRKQAEAESDGDGETKEAFKHHGATLIGMGQKALKGPSAAGKVKAVGERIKHHAGRAASAIGKAEGKASESVGRKALGAISGAGKQLRVDPKDARKAGRVAMGAGAVGVAGAGAGAAAAGKKKESAAQIFERQAAEHGIKVAAANNYDPTEVHERVEAVWKLGLEESEKVAHVETVEDAIHVRGLEYLEAAGVPVDWEEVFGGE